MQRAVSFDSHGFFGSASHASLALLPLLGRFTSLVVLKHVVGADDCVAGHPAGTADRERCPRYHPWSALLSELIHEVLFAYDTVVSGHHSPPQDGASII